MREVRVNFGYVFFIYFVVVEILIYLVIYCIFNTISLPNYVYKSWQRKSTSCLFYLVGDPEELRMWKKCRDLSIEEYEDTYKVTQHVG